MNTKRILALILSVMMLVGVMAACGTNETTEPSAENTGSGEALDLTVCLASEPQTIDPALNSSVDGGIMISHFFEGLMKWVDDGNGNAKLTEGQAKSYEKVVNEDGTATYTFTLRDGIKWSDGQPVTADDFVYSFQRLADPKTAADYNYLIGLIKGYNDVAEGKAEPSTLAVSAPDEKTVEITIINDVEYFTEICAFPATYPVRKDIIEANGDQWTFDPANYVSNGPYKMSEWEHNSYIKAVPSDTYYDADKTGPNSIKFQLMDDATAILSAFQSGTLQFIEEVPIDEIPTLVASGDLIIQPQYGTYYACFNTQKAPFDDARVREAFSLVIDRNYIVENVTQTGQVPADAFVCPGISDAEGVSGDDFRTVGGAYYSVKKDDYEANCEKARELLAEAGYPEGKGFPTVEYLYNTSDNHKAVGEALQNMWQTQLGVTVTLTNQEWGTFLQTRKDGNYSIARNGWLPDYNDAMSYLDMWLTGGGNNDAQYVNPDYDAAIEKAMTSQDIKERFAAMHEAEDLIIGQDKALAPIYFYTSKYMLDDSVKGMYYNPLGFYYFTNCYKG